MDITQVLSQTKIKNQPSSGLGVGEQFSGKEETGNGWGNKIWKGLNLGINKGTLVMNTVHFPDNDNAWAGGGYGGIN